MGNGTVAFIYSCSICGKQASKPPLVSGGRDVAEKPMSGGSLGHWRCSVHGPVKVKREKA
jgi:hypothetical protein